MHDSTSGTSPTLPTPSAVVLVPALPEANEPPPPYPSRDRRARNPRSHRARRSTGHSADHGHSQHSATGAESDHDGVSRHDFPGLDDQEHEASETTPLLNTSPRVPPPSAIRRQRTLSLTSTLLSTTSIAPSFAQTVLSAFNPDRDSDLDPDCDASTSPDATEAREFDFHADHHILAHDRRRPLTMEIVRDRSRPHSSTELWRKYFRPMSKRAYYSPLFHLLVLNFPYALAAWVYLFVFTLTGTTTLVALPLGAVLCFFDLLGARTFSRGELALQTTFHGPLAFPAPYPPHPLFTRIRPPSSAEVEAGSLIIYERSFYRNAYSMFTDPTSYQALFYFLVIKPGITLLLSIFLVVIIPVSFALILPAPAILRLVRRIGIWQANVAVEGLYYAVK